MPFSTCLTEDRISDYAPKAASYLAKLGCENPDVAQGAWGRIIRRRERSFDEDFLRSSFDEPRFARSLLASTCKGAADLPGGTKSALQRIAQGRTADATTPPHDLPTPENFESGGSGWSDIRDEARIGFKMIYWVRARPSQILDYYQKELSQGAWEVVAAADPLQPEGSILRFRRRGRGNEGTVRVSKSGPEMREKGWTRIEISLTEPREPE
jgi:hypothetical protein